MRTKSIERSLRPLTTTGLNLWTTYLNDTRFYLELPKFLSAAHIRVLYKLLSYQFISEISSIKQDLEVKT